MTSVDTGAWQSRALGRTGLAVGPMGISASYGVPTAAVEEAFEHGVNYLYWGSLRRDAFGQAIRNLKDRRDRMVIVLQSYSRFAGPMTRGVERGLRQLQLDAADVLLLGWWNHDISSRILDEARGLKARGLVRVLAVSTHNRRLAPALAQNVPGIDILHVRYNAVHRGAETDVFPHLPPENGPGVVSYTATSWKQLLGHKRIPAGERVPTAADCYRFVLSNPAVHVCMSGPARAEHVKDVIAAIDRGPMSEDELAWMRRVGDAIEKG